MRFLTLLFVVLLAASCSIQKRHYRPGFFVQRNATSPEVSANRPVKVTLLQEALLNHAINAQPAATGTPVLPAESALPGKIKPEMRILLQPAGKKPMVVPHSRMLKKQSIFSHAVAAKEGYSKRRKIIFAFGLIVMLFAVFMLFSGETAGFAGIGLLLLLLAVLLLLSAMVKDKTREKEAKEKPVPPADPDAANEKILKKKKRNLWLLPGIFVPLFLLVVSLLVLITTLSTLTVVLLLLLLFGISLLFLFLLLMGIMELQLTKDKIKKQQDSGSGK